MDDFNKCYVLPQRTDKHWLSSLASKSQSLPIDSDVEWLSSGKKELLLTSFKREGRKKSDVSCLWFLDYDIENRLKPIYQLIKNTEKTLSDLQNQEDEETIFFNKTTFQRAARFIIKYSKVILYRFDRIIDIPNVYPGPDGSIDILWKKSNYELLLNIPAEGNSIATFYGDNNKGEHIKGTINLDLKDINNGLILFLCDIV